MPVEAGQGEATGEGCQSFSELELHPRLLDVVDKLGFYTPTPVQSRLVPQAMAGNDLLVSARTGSGKTLAFLLPTLHRLLNLDPQLYRHSGTLALVLVPTRELAQQVVKECEQLCVSTPLSVAPLTGGDDFKRQVATLRKNPQILVATPGRLLEHFERRTPDFDDLQVLVIDEADRMLDMGFGDDVLLISQQCNQQRQTLLLSATLERKGLRGIGREILRKPQTITVDSRGEQHSDIRQQIMLADDRDHKQRILAWLLANTAWRKALVFCNTRVEADRLGALVKETELVAGAVLHGDMPQSARNRIMNNYRQGGIKVLFSTDLAARGLDVEGIDLVINFDMARSGDEHVHRVGRTGRAGQQGLAISLVSAPEWNLMSSIERYLKIRFERHQVESLLGNYKGPKKLKSSGKAAGTKKRKSAGAKAGAKAKSRQRDSKNKGKRRKPTTPSADKPSGDGYTPLKKKT